MSPNTGNARQRRERRQGQTSARASELRPRRWRRSAFVVAAAALAAVSAIPPAARAVNTWDGGGGNDNWNTAANWDTNTVPANDGTQDVTFAGTTRLTPNLNLNFSVDALRFINGAGNFVIDSSNSSVLTVGAGGIDNNDLSGTQTVNCDIKLGADSDWSSFLTGLSVGGNIDTFGNTLTVTGSGATGLSGVISGSGALTKSAGGTLTLSGAAANTYTGVTTVNTNTLSLNKSSGVAIAGDLVVGDGSGTDIVLLQNNNQIANGDITINSSGTLDLNAFTETLGAITFTGGKLDTGSGAGVFNKAGQISTLASSATASIIGTDPMRCANNLFDIADGSAAVDFDVAVPIQNFGGATQLIKSGAGTMRLSTANTYTGLTQVLGGTLEIGAGGTSGSIVGNISVASGATVAFNRSDNLTYSGSISGSSGSLVKSASGTLTLSGSNSYSGSTTINDGTLSLTTASSSTSFIVGDGSGAAGSAIVLVGSTIPAGTNVSVKSDGVFNYQNGASGATLHDITLEGGTIFQGGSVTTTLTGNITSNASAQSAGIGLVAINFGGAVRTINVADGAAAPDLIISSVLGSGSLVKTGAGTLRLANTVANTDTSFSVTVNAGTLELNSTAPSQNGAIPGALVIGDGVGGAASDVVRDIGGQINDNANVTVKSSGQFQIQPTSPGTIETIGSLILSDGGSVDVGSGGISTSLVLNQNVTYSGNVRSIIAGTQGTLDLNSGTHAFDVADGGDAVDLEIDVPISGGGVSVLKVGAGTLRLTGQILYGGGTTTISAGTLEFGAGGTGSAQLPILITDDAGLVINRGDDLTYSGFVSGSGTFTKRGSGTLTLTNTQNYTGLTTIAEGTLQLGNGGLAGSIAGDVLNNAALVFNRSNTLTYGGSISGTGAITKLASGTVTLTGNMPTSATWTLAQGTLQFGNGGVVAGLTGGTFANDAALAFNHSNDFTFGGTITGSGSLTKSGSGTLTLGSPSTRTGDTTVAVGTLRLASSTALGTADTGSNAILNGATLEVANVFLTKPFTLNDGATLRGTGTNAVVNRSNTVASGAHVTLATGSDPSDDFEFSATNALTGGGGGAGVTIAGAGTVILAASNNYAGSWNVSSGTLQVGNLSSSEGMLGSSSNSVAVASGATLRFEAPNFGTSRSFTLNGTLRIDSGTLQLFTALGTSTESFTRTGTGTLVLTASSGRSGDTTLSNGTTRLFNPGALGTGTVHVDSFGTALLIDAISFARSITVEGSPSLAGGSGTATFAGSVTVGSTASMNLATLQSTDTLKVGDSINDLNGGSASSSIAVNGPGRFILSQQSNYVGQWNLFGGTLQVDADNRLGSAGNVISLFNGTFAAASSFSTSRTIFSQTGGTVDVANGSILTFAGTLFGVATNSLIKTGAGQLTLNLAASLGAPIIVSGGTLQIGAGGTVGSVNQNITDNALVVFSRSDLVTYSGTISGSGSLGKSGAGTLVLTSNHSYSGGTSITNGTLQLGNGGVTGSVQGPIDDDGTLVYNHSDNIAIAYAITGGGTVSQDGTGSLTLSSTSNAQSVTILRRGTLSVSSNSNLGQEGSLNTLDLRGGTTFRITGNVSTTRQLFLGDQTATLNIDATGRTLTFNGTGANNLTGSVVIQGGALSFNRTNGVAVGVASGITMTINSGASLTLAGAPVFFDGVDRVSVVNNSTSSGFSVTSGSHDIGAVDGSGSSSVSTGATVTATRVRQGTLTLGGTAAVRASGGFNSVSRVTTLNFTGSGKVDLSDSKLIIGSTPITTITSRIASGRNGGNWSGSGIVTSQSDATNGTNFTSLGVATGQQVKDLASASDTATWAGQTVTGSDTLVMYTYGGDANLDGKVTISDYGKIDFGIGIPGASGWYNGDFNYDGAVTILDYGIIDFTIGIQGAPFPTGGSASLNGVSAIPEPTTFFGVATAALLARRARRRPRRPCAL